MLRKISCWHAAVASNVRFLWWKRWNFVFINFHHIRNESFRFFRWVAKSSLSVRNDFILFYSTPLIRAQLVVGCYWKGWNKVQFNLQNISAHSSFFVARTASNLLRKIINIINECASRQLLLGANSNSFFFSHNKII